MATTVMKLAVSMSHANPVSSDVITEGASLVLGSAIPRMTVATDQMKEISVRRKRVLISR